MSRTSTLCFFHSPLFSSNQLPQATSRGAPLRRPVFLHSVSFASSLSGKATSCGFVTPPRRHRRHYVNCFPTGRTEADERYAFSCYLKATLFSSFSNQLTRIPSTRRAPAPPRVSAHTAHGSTLVGKPVLRFCHAPAPSPTTLCQPPSKRTEQNRKNATAISYAIPHATHANPSRATPLRRPAFPHTRRTAPRLGNRPLAVVPLPCVATTLCQPQTTLTPTPKRPTVTWSSRPRAPSKRPSASSAAGRRGGRGSRGCSSNRTRARPPAASRRTRAAS